MSAYYNPEEKKSLRSKLAFFHLDLAAVRIDLFLNCPTLFLFSIENWSGPAAGISVLAKFAGWQAVKKEFECATGKGEPHPLMTKFGIDAIPYSHEKLNEWRDPFKGD